ncbi:MAG: hypothetical protein ACTSQZ_02725 [Candidatus Thorarchaeota archaeon]
MGDDEDFIMEEFEWALEDPTVERLKELGEVVSIITTKLIDAFGKLEARLDDIDTQLGGFDSRLNALDEKVARGVAAAPSAASSAAPDMASAPIASAPKPKPAGGGGGGGGMMGELKSLLAARRAKTDAATE